MRGDGELDSVRENERWGEREKRDSERKIEREIEREKGRETEREIEWGKREIDRKIIENWSRRKRKKEISQN